MLRSLSSSSTSLIPKSLHFLLLWTYPSPPCAHLCSQRLVNGSQSLPMWYAHYMLDEMPQRATFIYNHLKFLTKTSANNDLVVSLHSLSLKVGCLSDVSVRTSLLGLYARAWDLGSSLALFDEIDDPDLISWNAVISACVVNAEFHLSTVLFRELVSGFGVFDSTTAVIVLSAVTRSCELKHGLVIHTMVLKKRLDFDVFLCNALVDMYAKCGDLSSSECVFEGMQAKDVTSWNSIMHGCLYNNCPVDSAFFFREMNRSGVKADQVGLSCAVSACSGLKELFGFGISVHGCVIKLGCNEDSSVANSLISLYSRNEDVEGARHVFWKLVHKNVVSWNSIIHGLVGNDHVHEALHVFREMQFNIACQPDAITLVTIIPVFGQLRLLIHGKSMHGFAIRKELESKNLSILNSLLDMYLKCDDLISANILFKVMPSRDLITWNTLISGFSQFDSLKKEARSFFRKLLQTGLRCSLASILAILPSCTCPEDLQFGRTLHSWKYKYGFTSIVSVVNALMCMYINCGDLTAASLLLDSILIVSDVVSWNTMIVGCAQNGYYKDALEALEFMHCSLSLCPDPITFVSLLSACGNLKSLFHGKLIHGLASKSCIGSDVRVTNALLTMYLRCKDTESAVTVFHFSPSTNLCSWNCMISGLTQNKEGQKALEYFRQMENFEPNEMSLVGAVCACTQSGNLRQGMEVHAYVLRSQHQNNMFILSALIDMYSKCGRLDIAACVFQNSSEKSVASWNAMIFAYGFHGQGRKAIELFSKMSESSIKPTKSTYIAILSACCHSGLIDEAWKHYNCMSKEHGIKPTTEHHVCIVDMLGRAGMISEAFEFINKLPVRAESGIWGALLSACFDHGNVEIGKSSAQNLFCMEPVNTGYYVTLSNLYAFSGMWSNAVSVRGLIQDRKLKKPPGLSSINVRMQ
ncbi:TPR-like protein [Dioscorea alata]|uniref:TPR-like protein n=1 Tax=Dioscorea alata TaxID=55571 RepID=A0ACB7VQQ8_DIOAL|nr:TPR-like protein [Dioscorea alata]